MSDMDGGFKTFGEFARAVMAATPRVVPTPRAPDPSPDPLHDHVPRRVTLWDAVSGAVVTVDSTENLWWWTEGNGSCDCNREEFFPEVEVDDDLRYCSGCKRFLVVASDPVLDWVVGPNDKYPAQLQAQAEQMRQQMEAARGE